MVKKGIAFLLVLTFVFGLTGCTTPQSTQSSGEVEIIVEEETIVQGGNDVTSSNDNVNSIISNPQTNEQPNQQSNQQTNEQTNQQNDQQTNQQSSQQSSQQSNQQSNIESSQQSDQQSNQQTVSSVPEDSSQDSQPEDTNQEPEWKSHPQDFKLLAFTFDDGPSNNMSRLVQLFSWYEGTGTFFVRGNSIIDDGSYIAMQSAIDNGWDIGNHGDNHLVATIGGVNGGEATYDEIKADITNLTTKLETNLKTRDGAPYKVNLYRPPNIKPTANSFKVCSEQNLAVIWLKHDALDWDKTKTYNDRYNLFKKGINTWQDGDVILCHETGVIACDDTYKILEQLLPDFYRAGYRFCSISELMQMRDISVDEISGELNDVDGNRGMVTNIIDAAKVGKK